MADETPLYGDTFTLAQVANVLNCSTRTVRREIDRGHLRSVLLGRNMRRVLEADLRAYIDEYRGDVPHPVVLPYARVVEGVCLLTCGLTERDGGSGVALFEGAGLVIVNACPHLQDLTRTPVEQLADGTWVGKGFLSREVLEATIDWRNAGENYLTLNFPIIQPDGTEHLYDVLAMSVVNGCGEIVCYASSIVPAGSSWRTFLPANRIVDAAAL